MSLEKGIDHGKEHRKQYYGSKAIDRTCRNHGTCPWCLMNRTFKNTVRKQKIDDMLEEYMEEAEESEEMV